MNNFKMKHFVALLLIGDGIFAFMRPEHEVVGWSQGPWLWRQAMRRVDKNPSTTRLVATAQIITGVWWLVHEQKDKEQESLQ